MAGTERTKWIVSENEVIDIKEVMIVQGPVRSLTFTLSERKAIGGYEQT